MKVINFNRIMGATPIDRKTYKELVENNKFVNKKNFSRSVNAGWHQLFPTLEDLVYEFKGKYFLKIAIASKKIPKSMLLSMIDRELEENPIEKMDFTYSSATEEDQEKLLKEYKYDIETEILKNLEPTIEYYNVVYTFDKGEVTTIAVDSKSNKVLETVLSLFRSTFGAYEQSFHIGLDFDMTDFLKELVLEEPKIGGLCLGGKLKLQDTLDKKTTIDYKGFDIESQKDIRERIVNDNMAVANVELTYGNMIFVLDNKYMFSGIKPMNKHIIETGTDDVTVHDLMAGIIDDYFQMEEIQLKFETEY